MKAKLSDAIRRHADAVFDGLALAVLFVVGVAVVLSYGDYGITWDETWHIEYGEHIRQYYLTRGADEHALSFRLDYMYGGGFDLLGAWLIEVSRLDPYATIHLFGAFVGMAGLVGAWRLGRGLAGPLGGACSIALLALSPVYYGHMFNNPKDLPFAVGYVWALVYLVEVIKELPAVRRATWVKLTIACGVAMSVRVGGLLVLCYLAMIVVLYALVRARRERSLRVGYAYLEGIGLRALATGLGAWTIMLSAWPWAQQDPLRRPFIALTSMTKFKQHVRKVPVDGEWIYTYDVGWDYLPRYFGFKMTELVLALVLLGIVTASVTLYLRWRDAASLRLHAAYGLLGFAIVFPPVYAVYKSSALYDGLRHFLFLVPPLCVIAGVTLANSLRWLSRRDWRLAAFAALLAVAAGGELTYTMRHLHPHQYVFYNRLVGGLPGAYMNYSTDYYGNSYREAFELLDDYLWTKHRDLYLEERVVVAGCIPHRAAKEYMRPGWKWRRRGSREPADVYVGYTRNKCHQRYPEAEVVRSVKRFGTRLNVVKDVRVGKRERHERVPEIPPRPLGPVKMEEPRDRRD